jgi:phage shock protein A
MFSFLRRSAGAMQRGLEALLAPAEDPRQTYADAGQRQRQLLEQVRQALAQTRTLRARLEGRARQLNERSPELLAQAARAVRAGRDDLARLSLQRRQMMVIEQQTLEAQVREAQQEEARLALAEHRLTAQIEALQARQTVIAARYNAAEAQVRFQEALTGVSGELADLGLALEEAEEKADLLRARASALDEFIEQGILEGPGLPNADVIARQLHQLDLAQAVEDQLAALRQQVGSPSEMD